MMKNIRYNFLGFVFLTALILGTAISCSRDLDELELATFPTTAEVFIDGFSAGLNYDAFGGSKVTAFEVDTDVKYQGLASMRFDIPNADDSGGGFAAGIFRTNAGRDLSGYDALTFWAKATESVSIDEIGFGFTFEEEKYRTSIKGLPVSTSWKKHIIPLADASKLTAEKGLFYYVDTPEDGKGYTFWVDEVKFEKLGTIAHPQPAILEAQDQVITAETGAKLPIGGLFSTFNLPNGVDQRVELSPWYYTFSSSATSVAMVNELGVVSVIDSGAVVITAKLGQYDALGSLTIQSTGEPVGPMGPAPTPTVSADSVISLFSNAYENVPVDTWDTGWQFSNADVQDVQVAGDDVKRYKNLNFVGIEFTSQTIDATEMTHFHMDIWTPDPTELPKAFKVLLVDFGADGNFDGGDDSSHELSFTSPTLATETWVSLDVPLSAFAGLTTRGHLAQMVLSGDLPNVFVDNVYFYQGGDTGGPSGPTEAAPTPTQNAAAVISLFSDVYTDVSVDTWRTDWSAATLEDVTVEGNATKKYSALNFVGIETVSNTVDATEMTHFRMDVWSADFTFFGLKLVDFGVDGAFGGGDDVEHQINFEMPDQGGWVSYDIPLSDFTGLTTRGHLAQYILVGQPTGATTVYVDNVFFYKDGGGATEPTQAAPTPTQNASDVISVFSDAYTNIDGTDFNPNWGQSTVVTTEDIAGNSTLKYANFNYQGTAFGSPQDASAMEYLHIDLWTADATDVKMTPISATTGEKLVSLTPIVSGQWNSYDIPLSAFTDGGVSLTDLFQLKFDGQAGTNPSNIYLDNIYFYKDGGSATEPTQAAPTPTQAAADVISVFSDAYTNIDGTDFNPNWGQSTVVTTEDIAGNSTLKYANFNYQGTAFGSAQDVSAMEYLHVDMWTADATDVKMTPISGSTGENLVALAPIVSGQWNSYDIPLSAFTGAGVSMNDLIQLKFDGQAGTNPSNLYLDNIYFYSSGGGATEPTQAASTPTRNASDVISVFSDAYTNISGTDLNPNWGQATVVTQESIAGNNTLVYKGLNYQGTQLGSAQDVSGMEFLHIDYWTANSTALNVFLVSGGPSETASALTVPTSGWASVDIPLTVFTAVNLSDVIQLKFDGNGDIYLDNIYFYKSSSNTSPYAINLPIDFETSGFGADWTWTVFENDSNPAVEIVANPNPSGANTSATVAKFTALKAGQPYAGCETKHGTDFVTFTLDATNAVVKIMVYKSVISDVGIKFAQPDGGSLGELKVANTLINQWEELTFDFSSRIAHPSTVGQDQIVIFPDFKARAADNVIYFDNITFGAN